MLDRLYFNARLATMDPDRPAPYGAIENGAIGIRNGRFAYVGPMVGAPEAREKIDLHGAVATPALIDCHTHLVFGGNRANGSKCARRAPPMKRSPRRAAASCRPVKATREASLEDLVESAIGRLEALKKGGVATVEIKSGYGLTPGDEEKMLIAAGEAARATRLRVSRTLLGLHALPPEYKADREAYVRPRLRRADPVGRGARPLRCGRRFLRGDRLYGG